MVDFRLQRSNPAIRTLNKIADSHCLHWQGSNQVSTIVKLLIAYALREFLSGNYLALFTRVGTGGKGVEPSNFSWLPFDKILVVGDQCGSKHGGPPIRITSTPAVVSEAGTQSRPIRGDLGVA